MVSTKKDPVLAVLSLSGGNDGLNTVVLRNNGLYRDAPPHPGNPGRPDHPPQRRTGLASHNGSSEEVLGRG